MAAFSTAVLSRDLVLPQTAPRARSGVLRRILNAMITARQRQAERQIALYVERCGGKFTDETEREIERRFLHNSSW